ncbi:MAG: hypothetical protein OEY51_14300, partial [Cyclobacteriaceae bacterium]|nr:hypothetical protein [Cyclobacteriaceae bacterium]
PPSFSYHSPWWEHYGYLNHYFKRLSVALSAGKQQNDILVLEPTTSAWLYDSYVRGAENKLVDGIGKGFQQFVTTLEKDQVEYDLGSEDILANHGSVDRDRLVVGKCRYTKVVIPPLTENLNETTFGLLKDFAAGGGKIISFATPTLLDGVVSEDLSSFFKEENDQILQFNSLGAEVLAQHFHHESLQFDAVAGGNLYHHRRKMADGQIVFLTNSSLEEKTTGTLRLKGVEAVSLNAFTGVVEGYPKVVDGDYIRVSFSLPPAESLLLYISNTALNEFSPRENAVKYTAVPAKTTIEVTRERDNVLTIDFCDLVVSGIDEKDMHVYNASDKVFKEHGFENGDPWNHSIQYKSSIIDRGDFSEESGFAATYRFTIQDAFDYTNIRAVVEHPGLWSVSINGQEIQADSGIWWLDKSFGVYALGNWVRQGENKLSVSCRPMNIHAEIEPVYILGDFSVFPAQKGWAIRASEDTLSRGSWREQGMPFYSWGMVYKKVFDIQKLSTNYTVSAGTWKGTVAEVKVNGKAAGLLALHSDKVDVSDFIGEGTNTVEFKVIGSLKNLLGPHHNHPDPGLSSPWNWRGVTEYPPGTSYDMLDYGMMDDFFLWEAN